VANESWQEIPVRPKHIAAALGITDKKLRGWLRDVRPRPKSDKNAPWELAPAEADELVEKYRREQVEN
jgi:hypothetical protein